MILAFASCGTPPATRSSGAGSIRPPTPAALLAAGACREDARVDGIEPRPVPGDRFVWEVRCSFAAYQGGNAKLAGKEGVWEAVVGGAGGLALWSVFMLVAHLYREHKSPGTEVVRKKRPVKPVSRFSRVSKEE